MLGKFGAQRCVVYVHPNLSSFAKKLFEKKKKQFRDKSSSSSLSEDIGRVMLRGDGLHRATLNQPNEFIIDGGDLNKGKGN